MDTSTYVAAVTPLRISQTVVYLAEGMAWLRQGLTPFIRDVHGAMQCTHA